MKFREDNEQGSANFLKLKSGDSVRGVFNGEPDEFKQHWKDKKSILCPGQESCSICMSATDDMTDEEKRKFKPSFRFRLNFITKENGTYALKTFEQGWTVYTALRELSKAGYDLENHMMKITRNGSGTDTTYSIVPVPNGQLSKEDLIQVQAILKKDVVPF